MWNALFCVSETLKTLYMIYKIVINEFPTVEVVDFDWKIVRKEHSESELYKEAVLNIKRFYKVIEDWYAKHNLKRDNEVYDAIIISIMEDALKWTKCGSEALKTL